MNALTNFYPFFIKYPILSLILVVFILLAVHPFMCSIRLWRQRNDWKSLRSKIGTISLQDIQGLPEPSRYALSCVLTEKPGVGKPQAISPALEQLAAAVDIPLCALRSLSYLSVFIGLLVTVTLLAMTLLDVKELTLDHLRDIYPFNAVAIGIAAFLYFFYGLFHWQGDHFLLEASQILGSLHTDLPDTVDPNLVASLEIVAKKFTDWGEEIYTRNLGQVQALQGEMQTLSEEIRNMIREMIESRKGDEAGIIPLLEAQNEKVELLSSRLDTNFRDLASPIEGALQIMHQSDKRMKNLEQVILEIREADLPGQAAALSGATRDLASAVNRLPEEVGRQFQGVKKVIGEATHEGIKSGWEEMARPAFAGINNGIALLVDGQEIIKATLERMPQAVGQQVAESLLPILTDLTSTINRLAQSLNSIREMVARLPDEVSQGVMAGIQPLIDADISEHLGEFTQVVGKMTSLIQQLPSSMREIISSTNERLAQTMSKVLREELTNLRNSLKEFTDIIHQQVVLLGETFWKSADKEFKTTLDMIAAGPLQDIKKSIENLGMALKEIKPAQTSSLIPNSRPQPYPSSNQSHSKDTGHSPQSQAANPEKGISYVLPTPSQPPKVSEPISNKPVALEPELERSKPGDEKTIPNKKTPSWILEKIIKAFKKGQ